MAFNLATFQQIMGVAQAAITEAGSVTSEWGGGDHVGAVNTAIQTAGAVAASVTTNPQSQQEAVQATQLATTLVPIIMSFASLFAKKV